MATTYAAQIRTAAGKVPHGVTPEELTPEAAAAAALYQETLRLPTSTAAAVAATLYGHTLEIYSIRRSLAGEVRRELVSATPLGTATVS